MRSYEAYCAVCDANVRITPDAHAEHPLEGAVVECLERGPSCDRVTCPLEGATPEQLADRLEFLPRGGRAARSPEGAARDPEDVVRRGRINAMRRGEDPVR
jgi:hypothetical protein